MSVYCTLKIKCIFTLIIFQTFRRSLIPNNGTLIQQFEQM